jgi:hypothetical protein
MLTSNTFGRDGNHVPITTFGFTSTKEITFASATTGAIDTTTLFTVTGLCAVKIIAVCSADLTSSGAATIEVGIAGNTAGLIAQTTATNIDKGEIWLDNSPATLETFPVNYFANSAQNIIQTIATETISGGTLKYYCFWLPLSEDGSVA